MKFLIQQGVLHKSHRGFPQLHLSDHGVISNRGTENPI